MKRLIKKIFVFTFFLFLITNILIFLTASENYFINGIWNKHEKLKNISGKRIIFIGGSGVGHSLDSELIAQETDYYPINMGLFAQFGLRYMLEETKENIKEDDIIVIVPEYHHFYYFLDGWRGLGELIFVYPQFISHITSFKQIKTLISFYPEIFIDKMKNLRKNLKSKFEKDYNNLLYNDYGDYVAHLHNKDKHEIDKKPLFHKFIDIKSVVFEEESLRVLNEYYDYAKKKGAVAYFSYPTIPKIKLKEYSDIINEVNGHMESQLRIPILNTSESETQETLDFYNTIYHLNINGREKRTKRILKQLKDSCLLFK